MQEQIIDGDEYMVCKKQRSNGDEIVLILFDSRNRVYAVYAVYDGFMEIRVRVG